MNWRAGAAGRRRPIAALVACCVLGLLAVSAPAGAENLGPGGGTRIITGDEVAGSYRLLITSSPEPAQAGKVTYVVRVSDPVTGQKVRDAEVSVTLVHEESGATLQGSATHLDAGNELDYAAHITIEQPGNWSGSVRVAGSEGSAEVKFLQRVTPRRRFNTLLVAGLPFLVLLGILGGLWIARSGARKPAQG